MRQRELSRVAWAACCAAFLCYVKSIHLSNSQPGGIDMLDRMADGRTDPDFDYLSDGHAALISF